MPTFERQLREFAERTKVKLNVTVAEIYRGLAASVITKSPVAGRGTWVPPKGYDPGNFKANWNGAFGSADLTYDKELVDPTGEVSMVRINSAIPKNPIGKFFISNSHPASEILESGSHSIQVPPGGMVARTVLEFDGIVEQAVLIANGATLEASAK